MNTELFLENYNNRGMCEGLEKFKKVIVKDFKKSGTVKNIPYLPWAVVERIFRLQGGKIEVLDFNYNVEFKTQVFESETGIVRENVDKALFVHLKATWQDEELEEFYPIFDNQNSRVVKNPDAQQLNLSRQRGSVRLIARISGIGLWIFEQQEESDDEEDSQTVVKPVVKKEVKEETIVKERPIEVVKVPYVENKEKVNTLLNGEVPVVEETTNPFTQNVNVEEYEPETEEFSNALLDVKRFVKVSENHKQLILNYKNEKKAETMKDLKYSQLIELKQLLEKVQ